MNASIMILSANDLFLSRRIWNKTFNGRSKRQVMMHACEERGIIVDEKASMVEMSKTWYADLDDEMKAIQASTRMAERRHLDISKVPPLIMNDIDMTLTVDDLYLSRRLWHVSPNMGSTRPIRVQACEERGIVVCDKTSRNVLLKMWKEDGQDETLLIDACRRIADRRGIDISNVPYVVFPPRYRPPPLRK